MNLISIGSIRSPFREMSGTPIQPRFATGSDGQAILLPQFSEGLSDLAGFDRIWILFWCDRAKSAEMSVVPYRDRVARGLFSTRAPARPNPIGLSCVRLKGIAGAVLHLAELDILDGSTVLDIKPYVPEYDSYPESAKGWISSDKNIPTADARFSK